MGYCPNARVHVAPAALVICATLAAARFARILARTLVCMGANLVGAKFGKI